MKNYRIRKTERGWCIEKKLSEKESLLVSGNTSREVYNVIVNHVETYADAEDRTKSLACSELCIGDIAMEF